MRIDAFDYDLPVSLIAQRPLEDRGGSRLLAVNRSNGEKEHGHFRDLVKLVEPGDVIVVNRSRVIPARFYVRRHTGGRVELLVTEIVDDTELVAIGSPLRRLKTGDILRGEGGGFSCTVIERLGDRQVRLRLASGGTVREILEAYGHVPLPPYIDRPDEDADRSRYQTVFSRESGSIAAPTAGLHFDDSLLTALIERGAIICSVVLHVGLGTFLPLESDVVEENTLHRERYTVDKETIDRIRAARSEGRRVIAVGTTVTRVLESVADTILHAGDSTLDGETSLFVYPGYEFKIIDGLITNFHLPRSSLLLLVCAFLGTETTLACYAEAVERGYRFYSYGDAMFIR